MSRMIREARPSDVADIMSSIAWPATQVLRNLAEVPCVLYRNAFHFDTKRIPFPYKTSPVLIQNATLVEDMHLL